MCAHLPEHAILVSDSITPSWQIECGYGVKEAGSKATKTPIAQCSILLCVNEILEAVSKLLDCLTILILKSQVEDRVEQRAAHQKFC